MDGIGFGFSAGRAPAWLMLLSFIISPFIVIGVGGSIHEYRDEAFAHRSNALFFHGGSEGLHASKSRHQKPPSASDDKPLLQSQGKAFIRFDGVTFTRPKESASKKSEMQQNTGLVEAIILDVKDRERIGASYLKSDEICCTKTMSDEGSCKVGEVIIHKNSDNPDWPKRIKTFFDAQYEQANMEPITVDVDRTGMYYLYFVICDPELNGTLIKGRTVWRNPDGYLPGKMAPLMTFFGIMSLAYLVLGLCWFLRFVKFWKDIIQLHYHITAVIALGMCEMALWYYEYAHFNSTGTRPWGVTLWAVTFTAVKKTLSRLLLLVVSMGFGVVKPTLGGITSKILILGTAYFIVSESYELIQHLGNINDFSGKTALFLLLPLTFLDTGFILWIFSSLSKTLEQLQMKRNMAKLELYRKFTNSLAVSVLLSIAWIGFELYFNASDPLSELWQIYWIIPAFWCLISYSLLVVICVLWAPSQNPTRYASLEGSDDFDEEGVALASAIKVTGDNSSEVGEDLEEDKRE